MEASEDSDLSGFEMDDDDMEDLEVVEDTLRTGGVRGSFDEFGPTMDSAVMDEYTDELPRDGLWLPGKGAGPSTDPMNAFDPTEHEPTEPGLPFEELLPPLDQRQRAAGLPVGVQASEAGAQTDHFKDYARELHEDTDPTPTAPPPDPSDLARATSTAEHTAAKVRPRRELDPAAVETLREVEAERAAVREERALAQATPWLAAMGMSVGLGAAGLFLVLAAWFLFGRTEPFDPDALPAQPPIEAPITPVAVEAPEGEGEGVEEVVEEPEPEPEPAARPRPRPTPEPEAVAVEEDPVFEPEPEPEPVPIAPTPPAPDPKEKRGLFGKKKK